MNVRIATEDDIAAIVAMCHDMRAESIVPFPPMEEEVYRERLAMLGPAYLLLVAECDDAIVGFMGAQLGIFVFSSRIFVYHDMFYVKPEKRGTKAAMMLVTGLETWAAECRADRVCVGLHTGLNPDRLDRFYRKLGYTYMGGNYFKEMQ